MDAFEQVVSELLWAEGYWTQTSYKVRLTKEEKVSIGKPSSPRWEIDVLAYSAKMNVAIAVECKSYLNSRGVRWADICGESQSTRYKLFRDHHLRSVVLGRIKQQLIDDGHAAQGVEVQLGFVAGNINSAEADRISSSFSGNGWMFFHPDWLRARLLTMQQSEYENQATAVVAKLMRR